MICQLPCDVARTLHETKPSSTEPVSSTEETWVTKPRPTKYYPSPTRFIYAPIAQQLCTTAILKRLYVATYPLVQTLVYTIFNVTSYQFPASACIYLYTLEAIFTLSFLLCTAECWSHLGSRSPPQLLELLSSSNSRQKFKLKSLNIQETNLQIMIHMYIWPWLAVHIL